MCFRVVLSVTYKHQTHKSREIRSLCVVSIHCSDTYSVCVCYGSCCTSVWRVGGTGAGLNPSVWMMLGLSCAPYNIKDKQRLSLSQSNNSTESRNKYYTTQHNTTQPFRVQKQLHTHNTQHFILK